MSQDQEYTADSLLKQADEVFQSRDYVAAHDEYLQVAERARQEFNRSVETEALSQVARTSLLLGEKDAGRDWLTKAFERATNDDPMGWSRYLGVRGRFEWQDGDIMAARKTFDEMYVYCNTNGLWGRSVDAAPKNRSNGGNAESRQPSPGVSRAGWGRSGITWLEPTTTSSSSTAPWPVISRHGNIIGASQGRWPSCLLITMSV